MATDWPSAAEGSRQESCIPSPIIEVQGVPPRDPPDPENRSSRQASTSQLPPQGARPPVRYWSHAQNTEVAISSLAEEIAAFQSWDFQLNSWKTTHNFYPDYLYEEEEKSVMIRSLFRAYAQFALERWRQVGSQMPKLYPSHTEWEKHHQIGVSIMSALVLYTVKGAEDGTIQTRYFIDQEASEEIMETIADASKHITMASRKPTWGVPSHMLHQGMTQHEAQAASALYQAELEMTVYELFVATEPGRSNQTLLRNPQLFWTYVKPLWKDTPPTFPTRRVSTDQDPSTSTSRQESAAATLKRAADRAYKTTRMRDSPIQEVTDEDSGEEWNALQFTPMPPQARKPRDSGNAYARAPGLNLGRIGSTLFGQAQRETEPELQNSRHPRDQPPHQGQPPRNGQQDPTCYVARFSITRILWPYVCNSSLEPRQTLQPITSGSR